MNRFTVAELLLLSIQPHNSGTEVMRRVITLAICSTALASCGGGGSDSSSSGSPAPTPPTQSVGGIWQATYTENGVTVNAEALVAEDGHFYFRGQNTSNNCVAVGLGMLQVSGANVTGNVTEAFVTTATNSSIQTGCVFSDGTNSATGTLQGTVAQRSTLTLTVAVTTTGGTALPSSTHTWTFNSLYNETSALSKLVGNWTGPTGVVTTINADGTFFAQDPSSGCVVNGKYSIINASYNAYSGTATYASCQGNAAVLNGLTATGLVTLDDQVNPNELVGGASVTLSSGQTVIVVASATKS